MYVMVTGLILGAAIYTQANLLFWAFGLMVGGLAISLLLSWQMLRAIQVQRLLPGHGVCGEALVLRYHLTNRSWLPVFGLMVHETWGQGGIKGLIRRKTWRRVGPVAETPQRLKARPHGWVLHIGPHQVIQAEATCWPMRRGVLTFERIVVSTSFPFGIIRKVVESHQPADLLVYPHLYRMNRRTLYSLSQLDPSGRKQVERAGGTEEFYGIRPYRVGDSLKMIEWKRSARTGELVAREMTQPSPPRVMVLLDLRDPDDEAKENAISLTASLICDAHFHGYQIGLAVAGARCTVFPVHHSLPHRTRMLEALAGLNLQSTNQEMPSLTDRPSVIVVPGRGDDGAQAARSDRIRGRAAVLGAADLEQHVSQGGAGGDLLHSRVRPTSRREEIEERSLMTAGAP